MVFPAPPACRHPVSRAGSALRHHASAGAFDQQTRLCRGIRPDRADRSVDLVKSAVTGAHYGLRDWLAQRVTAVIMVVFILCLTLLLLLSPPSDYAEWKAVFSNQWMRIASFLFLVSLFWHAWIGMRDILMDYIKPTGIRLALQVLVVLALIAYSVWSMTILWSI